jgi:AcrR family transcriptional regulator
MGYKHSREQILEAAMEAALEDGLSQLTFGRLAKRIGISDRTIVYYFATKDELIGAVMAELGGQLQGGLADAFSEPAADPVAAARMAWPRLARQDLDPLFGLFFELSGLAAAGREPYRSVSTVLLEQWRTWLQQFFTGTDKERRTAAEATMALIDGLLLLRQLLGPAAAQRAATALGVA